MPKDYEACDILYALKKVNTNCAALDRAYNLARGSCYEATRKGHIEAEQVIANTLGVHPKDIWPSRYDSAGERIRTRIRNNYNSLKTKSNVNNTEAFKQEVKNAS